ncbi:CoA-transferase [Sinorhizobium meliloti]|uniref:CoA-transferase n=1 Tax=Rhizobium meliloti TaxID=382 RepID=UPI00299D9EE9
MRRNRRQNRHLADFVEGRLRAIHANKADAFGNLAFSAAARNFNPLMAMAAARTIVGRSHSSMRGA